MQTKKRVINKRGTLAISQIIILVLGIVAIAYATGSSIGRASAKKVKDVGECYTTKFGGDCPEIWT